MSNPTTTLVSPSTPARDFLLTFTRARSPRQSDLTLLSSNANNTPSPSSESGSSPSPMTMAMGTDMLFATELSYKFTPEEIESVSKVIAEALNCLIEHSTTAASTPLQDTRQIPQIFDTASSTPPELDWYVARWLQFGCCSVQAYGLALYYIDELFNQGRFVFTRRNMHKIFSTALMAATKMLEDRTYSNYYYARIAGVSLASLFDLELCFLSFFGFSIHAGWDPIAPYVRAIESLLSPRIVSGSTSATAPTTTTPTPTTTTTTTTTTQ